LSRILKPFGFLLAAIYLLADAVFWGVAKPVALFGLGLTALFGFLHYVSTGPNEVEETDEEQAKKAIEQPGDDRDGR